MNRQLKLVVLLTTLFLGPFPSLLQAEEVALKTNLLSDATLNPNVGAEVALAPHWTLDLEGSANFWTLSGGKRWKHWALQPEARYWLCNRMDGHFFGLHMHGGQYNVGGLDLDLNLLGTHFSRLKDNRYQGWFLGAGLSYGYAWVLSRHWNLEAELGVGYSFTRYSEYPCAKCGKASETNHPHNYVGVTRAAVNVVYVF